MKTINLLLFIIILSSASVFSQNFNTEKPDYKEIEKEISNENSDFYYPKLMQKYLDSDTTMTLDEKRDLYYGYSFQKKYSPYGFSNFNDSVKTLFQKDKLNENELITLIKFSDSILVENPFDLRALNHKAYAFKKLENRIDYDKTINQMRIIFSALISSGDGLTKETAYYVISVSHEYDLLNILGFEFGDSQSLIEHYDYLKLAKNSNKIKGLYFDVSPCLNSLDSMFK